MFLILIGGKQVSIFYRLQSKYAYFFLTCLAAFVFLMIIKLSYAVPFLFSMPQVYTAAKLIVILILILFLLQVDVAFKIKLAAIICLSCLYLLSKRSGDSDILYYAIFIFAAYKIDFQTILKVLFWTELVGICLIIFSSITGLIPSQIVSRPGENSALRFSLGFLTPTDFAARIFYLQLLYFAWRKFDLATAEKIGSIVLLTWTYLLTNARLDLIMMILLLLASFFYQQVTSVLNRMQTLWIGWLVAIYLLLNLALTVFFNPDSAGFQLLDKLLSHRLAIGQTGLFDYGVTFLGQHVIEHSNGTLQLAKQTNYFYLDSSYLRLLVISGLLITAAVCWLIFYLIRLSDEKQAWGILIVLLLVIISSAIDQHLMQLSYNFVFLAALADLRDYQTDVGHFTDFKRSQYKQSAISSN